MWCSTTELITITEINNNYIQNTNLAQLTSNTYKGNNMSTEPETNEVKLMEYRNGIYGYDWKDKKTYTSKEEALANWDNDNHGYCQVQLVQDGVAFKYADARYF